MVNLSWKCNYGNCPYCWTNQVVRNTELYKMPDKPANEWSEALNKLDPAIFDFVGGEPLIFPDFINLVGHLDQKHEFAVTSNLFSDNLFDFISLIQPKQCIHFTGSWHPTGKLNLEQFCIRMQMLRDSGFSVSVNVINHESIKEKIEEAVVKLNSVGIAVLVSPYEHPPDLLNPHDKTFTCNGGINHYVLNNNGDVYRCLSWFRHPDRQKAWLGNIFDKSFKKLSEKQTCSLPCEMHYVVDKNNSMIKDLEIQTVENSVCQ